MDQATKGAKLDLDRILKTKIAAFQVQGKKGKNMNKFTKASICCTAYAMVKHWEALGDPKIDEKKVIHCSIMAQYQNQSSIGKELR